MRTLRDMINDNARRYPNKIAFKFEAESYTFGQVNRRINSLTNALADLGIGKGDRVGILAYNCPRYFELFGLAKAGRVCVPLNHRSVGRELSYLINHSELSALVLESDFIDVVDSIRDELKGVREFVCLDGAVQSMRSYEQLIEDYPPDEPTDDVEPDDLCTLFYTSGTTGWPKGAIHTHRSLV
ncbi:MAG: AMP-binding protein, partial [Anaerolineae bacterium]